MEGLVPATTAAITSTFQLILEHLCAVLLLFAEGLGHVPALPAFAWVILGVILVVVSLAVMRRPTSQSVKALSERCPVQDEVHTACEQGTGPVMEADNALKSPGLEAKPPLLQTLCLRALNKQLSRMLSLQDLADLVKTVHKSQSPKRFHVTSEEPISKAPRADGDKLQDNTPDNFNQNTHYPARPGLRQDEIVGWEQNIPEKEEEQQLEQSMAQMERVRQGRVTQSMSMQGNPLQASPRPEVKQQREAGDWDLFTHGSEDDLKGVPPDADLNEPPQHANEEDQETTRQLGEQKQRSEELAAEITSLRTEKASLQCENSTLKAEIQQLKLKLQVRSDTHEDHFSRLQRQVLEAEALYLDMEKRFLNNWRNMDTTYQLLNTYKKMAQDMNQELRRSTSCYEKEVRFHWERAEEARMAAECAGRRPQELRRETDRSRQMLAKAPFQPFPGHPFGPAAPSTAHRGPEVPGSPLGHQVPRREQGHAVSPQESRRTCGFDSVSAIAGP